jgi:hypothetical protein
MKAQKKERWLPGWKASHEINLSVCEFFTFGIWTVRTHTSFGRGGCSSELEHLPGKMGGPGVEPYLQFKLSRLCVTGL